MKIHTASHRRKRELPRSGVTPLPAHPTAATAEIKFCHLVDRVHRLGPRPVSELLIELIGNDDGLQADALLLLEKYAALDPAMVRALGADAFPPTVFAVGPI